MTNDVTEVDPVLPAPPKGFVWLLTLNVEYDWATLRLAKLKWWSKTRIDRYWYEESEILTVPHPVHKNLDRTLKPLSADIETIMESAVNVARKILTAREEEPRKTEELEVKAAQLSQRLGIKVEVR